jgi:hypothetical protein
MNTDEEPENKPDEMIISDGALRDYIVSYTGDKLQPEKDEVTIEMVIDILAIEFPEVVLAIATENFLRGYEKGLNDAENGFMSDEEKPDIFRLDTDSTEET